MCAHVLGIDPGKTGAAVLLSPSHQIVYRERFDKVGPSKALAPINHIMCSTCQTPITVSAAIEKVHSMPGQGVVSMFTFGTEFGKVIGFCEAMGWPTHFYPPQTWQKKLSTGNSPKERVQNFSIPQFGAAHFLYTGCRVFHQGTLDAAAIAYFHSTYQSLNPDQPGKTYAKKKGTSVRF